MLRLLLFISLLVSFAHAELIAYKLSNSKKFEFSLDEFCQALGGKNAVIRQSVTISQVECMGKIYSVIPFCDKKFGGHQGFVRAYVDRRKEKVVCQTAQRAIVTYQCSREEKVSGLCKDSFKACIDMKQKLARNMALYRHLVIQNLDDSAHLKCFFEMESDRSLYIPESIY